MVTKRKLKGKGEWEKLIDTLEGSKTATALGKSEKLLEVDRETTTEDDGRIIGGRGTKNGFSRKRKSGCLDSTVLGTDDLGGDKKKRGILSKQLPGEMRPLAMGSNETNLQTKLQDFEKKGHYFGKNGPDLEKKGHNFEENGPHF